MTDKSSDPSESAQPKSSASGAPTPVPPASSTGKPVTSPFDSPTQQISTSKNVPRTDDDLGLDPDDVPSAKSGAAGTPATAAVGATDSTSSGSKSDTGGQYSYASIPPAAATTSSTATLQRRTRETRRGTLDFGLLILRLVIGGTFIYHGLQKLAGWFHGPGIDGTKAMMEGGGWDYPSLSAALLIAGELGGGILLVLGLATPLAAGALLSTILGAWMWKQGMLPGFQYNMATKTGTEYESVLSGVLVAILFTGPGRLSIDRARGWATRPGWGSVLILVLAVAAAIATYLFLHGGNPLQGIGPFDAKTT
ncbi:DoxX family protein [Nocardia camponoti]|uniref:DoxX family protein n=1 Tax=Nocardia camponoti TaxID=1616106 RepID=UPI00166CAC7D|nr:DoxX family protein [Nocardia camponoti]